MNGMMPARMPMPIAADVFTKPHAGVITTRPATAPEQKPRILGLPLRMYSVIAQANDATALHSVVVANELAATPSAAAPLPALKRYHPTHRIPLPTIESTMQSGRIRCLQK